MMKGGEKNINIIFFCPVKMVTHKLMFCLYSNIVMMISCIKYFGKFFLSSFVSYY